MNDQVRVTEESIDISAGERQDLLDLVEEKQESRSGKLLTAETTPKILLPYQARWHEDKSVVRLAEKSRRIGWSWGALAAEGALEAARPKGKGMDQFYMGYNMAMAAENIGDVVFFAQAYGFAVSEIDVRRPRAHVIVKNDRGQVISNEKQDITTYKVQFASGHVYEALSSNPHNWRGRQGHARIDEAAFHKNLQEVVKAALAFRLWGGRIDIVSTHNGEDNQFNLWVRDIKAKKLNWSLHHVDFDQALADGFYKRICLVTGKTWSRKAEQKFRDDAFADYPDSSDANEELLCIPKRGSGVYFSRILLEQCMEEGIPTVYWYKSDEWVLDQDRLAEAEKWCEENLKPILDSLPTDQRTVYGQDFARSSDLSPTWILQEDAPNHWRQRLNLELRNIPFDVQAYIRDYILDSLPLLHGAGFDARGNGEAHAEQAQQKYGLRVLLVKATAEWYATYFPRYHQAYEDQSITIAKNEDIIADHRLVELHKGRPRFGDGRIKGSDGKPRHGDTASAGLIAWAVVLQEGQPSYGESVEDKDTDALYKPESARGRQRVSMFGRNRSAARSGSESP
ncbi:MAG: terminase family protein [Candidatus Thiodiazotropha taylori]